VTPSPEGVASRLRSIRATRYVTPFREGGSLPGLVEADDDGLYVVKFRGAGQGPRALVAEWIVGEIGRALGLLVPDLVRVELDPEIADSEPDEEVHDLLVASVGTNLGVDFLPGSITFNAAAERVANADWAADVVWFDAFTTNPDRTARNPNLLVWHGRTWLIDHGAALYVHHGGGDVLGRAGAPFAAIRDHVLLPHAGSLLDADARLGGALGRDALEAIAALVPAEWTGGAPYAEHLAARLAAPRAWVKAAEAARLELAAAPSAARDEEVDRGRA